MWNYSLGHQLLSNLSSDLMLNLHCAPLQPTSVPFRNPCQTVFGLPVNVRQRVFRNNLKMLCFLLSESPCGTGVTNSGTSISTDRNHDPCTGTIHKLPCSRLCIVRTNWKWRSTSPQINSLREYGNPYSQISLPIWNTADFFPLSHARQLNKQPPTLLSHAKHIVLFLERMTGVN